MVKKPGAISHTKSDARWTQIRGAAIAASMSDEDFAGKSLPLLKHALS